MTQKEKVSEKHFGWCYQRLMGMEGKFMEIFKVFFFLFNDFSAPLAVVLALDGIGGLFYHLLFDFLTSVNTEERKDSGTVGLLCQVVDSSLRFMNMRKLFDCDTSA